MNTEPSEKRSTKEALILIAEEAEACVEVMGPHGELVRGVQLDVYRRVSELARAALADLEVPQGEPSPAPAGDEFVPRQWMEAFCKIGDIMGPEDWATCEDLIEMVRKMKAVSPPPVQAPAAGPLEAVAAEITKLRDSSGEGVVGTARAIAYDRCLELLASIPVAGAPSAGRPVEGKDGSSSGSPHRAEAAKIQGAADLAFELASDICSEHCDLDPDDQEKMAHCAWCDQATKVYQWLKALLDGEAVGEAASAEPAPTQNYRDCTCLGTCKGKEGLSPGWKCALETEAAYLARQAPIREAKADPGQGDEP